MRRLAPTGFEIDVNMLQKCAILGLVLLLAGGLAFGWLYQEKQNERELARKSGPSNPLGPEEYLEKYGRWYQLSPEEQNRLVLELDDERKSKSAGALAQEQQARLRADLDKLAAGQMSPGDIAGFLYGHGWQAQVEEYKKHKEQMEIVQTISTVCLSIGGTLFGGCTAIGMFLRLARMVRGWRQRSSRPEADDEPEIAELMDIEVPSSEPQTEPDAPVAASEEPPKQRRRLLTRAEASDESGPGESGAERATSIDEFFTSLATHPCGGPRPAGSVQAAAGDNSVALLLADEPSQPGAWSPEAQWSLHSSYEAPFGGTSKAPHSLKQTGAVAEEKNAVSMEHPLKEQAEDLQKQIAEFKQMAQNVQQATREQSEPLSSTLKELTQQVSAIREYAASQQDRVEKLQDGYDWGIIRTFCLRVIRCIDNLESRLADLPEGHAAASPLEEVKDELLFALESSGVEQFRPEVNSEFHGQEKLAEAIKERQPAKKPEQSGRIARVLRPGYRYLMDDENYRTVRTAQVKLFG